MSVTRDSVIDLMEAEVIRAKQTSYHSAPIYSVLAREHGLFMSAGRNFQANRMQRVSKVACKQTGSLGRHLIADLKITDHMKNKIMTALHPHKFLQEIICAAANLAGATILRENSFWQERTGALVAAVVIEESHLSLHFIPRFNYVAVDVFTCGDIKFDKAVAYIVRALEGMLINKTELSRGVFFKDKLLEADLKREMGPFIPGTAIVKQDQLFFLQEDGVNHNNGEMDAALGQHVIAEFYLCNPGRINDHEFVQDCFAQAIVGGGGSLKMNFVHCFSPQGISDMAIGAEDYFSHLTVHDWPEWGAKEFGAYAAIDLCSFSTTLDVQKVMNFLAGKFQCQRMSLHTLPRGISQLTLKMASEQAPKMRCGLGG